jgi:hypothetical protein
VKKEHKNIVEARRSLKAHIAFLETLLEHLNGVSMEDRGRALVATYCIHRYFNEKFIAEINDIVRGLGQNKEHSDAT